MCPHNCMQKEPGKVLILALNPECIHPQLVTVREMCEARSHVEIWVSPAVHERSTTEPAAKFHTDTLAENGVSRDSRQLYTPRAHHGITYGSLCHTTTAWWRIRSNNNVCGCAKAPQKSLRETKKSMSSVAVRCWWSVCSQNCFKD